MEVKLIGTGSLGAKNRGASSLIDGKILVDMPNGNMKILKQMGYDVLSFPVILITHLHGDHFFDLPFFLIEKYFYKSTILTKIYCPTGTEEVVRQVTKLAFPDLEYETIKEASNVEFIEFSSLNEEVLPEVYVTSLLMSHGKMSPAHGYCVSFGDKKIGFSGDTGLCESVEEMVRKCNISVLDMSLAGVGNESHMGLEDIKMLCEKYADRKVVATHMHDFTRGKAKSEKISNLIIPEDGDSFEI